VVYDVLHVDNVLNVAAIVVCNLVVWFDELEVALIRYAEVISEMRHHQRDGSVAELRLLQRCNAKRSPVSRPQLVQLHDHEHRYHNDFRINNKNNTHSITK